MKTPKKTSQEFWNSLEMLSKQHWLSREFKGRGNFFFGGHFNFTGQWIGEIKGDSEDSHLVIHRGSVVSGTIECQKLSVYGKIEGGRVFCDEFRAYSGAQIEAQVWAKTLKIEEGAQYQGSLKSTRVQKPAEIVEAHEGDLSV